MSELFKSLVSGKRSALATAITLVESKSPSKRKLATDLVQKLYDQSTERPPAIRLALTGSPGSGKSCLIESLGLNFVERGYKVAVLAIDPSSPATGGSLLGDKTRMTNLARHPSAYIRPSPSSLWLGGVTKATGESIMLCEAAGFDLIMVETVGVGQSEGAVKHVTDICSLVLSPNSGDELQALKKGIVELCDFFLVNKADGASLSAAMRMKSDFISATKFMGRRHEFWDSAVQCVSAHTGKGIDELAGTVLAYHEGLQSSGGLDKLRRKQRITALKRIIEDSVYEHFWTKMANDYPEIEQLVMERSLTPSKGADKLLEKFLSSK